jgi:type II secretory pathway component PulF
MGTYTYTGKDSLGRPVRGFKRAASRSAALAELGQAGVVYSTLESGIGEALSLGGLVDWFDGFMSSLTLAASRLAFWRIARVFVRRGQDVDDAILAYLPECPNGRFADVLRSIITERTKQGVELPDALSRHSEFPRQEVAMVRATYGTSKFVSAVEHIEKIETLLRRGKADELVNKLSAYVAYVSSLGLAIFVGIWYLPQASQTLEAYKASDSSLPPAMFAIAAVGRFMGSPLGWLMMALGFFGLRQIWKSYSTQPQVAKRLERVMWMLPGYKEHALRRDHALVLHFLSSLVDASVEQVSALEQVADLPESAHFREALARQAKRLAKNDVDFVGSFVAEPLWGAEVRGLISGSKGSNLVSLMEDIAGDFDELNKAGQAVLSRLKGMGHLVLSGSILGVVTLVVYMAGLAMTYAVSQSIGHL